MKKEGKKKKKKKKKKNSAKTYRTSDFIGCPNKEIAITHLCNAIELHTIYHLVAKSKVQEKCVETKLLNEIVLKL